MPNLDRVLRQVTTYEDGTVTVDGFPLSAHKSEAETGETLENTVEAGLKCRPFREQVVARLSVYVATRIRRAGAQFFAEKDVVDVESTELRTKFLPREGRIPFGKWRRANVTDCGYRISA